MKTKPHTIRFEESDYEFIAKREGLKTAQSILNFLLKEYLKLYKVEKKSVFDIEKPITDKPIYQYPLEEKDMVPRGTYFEVPKVKSLNRSAEQWQAIKRECGSLEEWDEIKQQIMDAENLSSKQKQIIINTP